LAVVCFVAVDAAVDDEVFKELRRVLCSSPILPLSRFKANSPPFVRDTDAGDSAVGGAVSQVGKGRRGRLIMQHSTQHYNESNAEG
ncbi:hypothetical protein TSMEX_010820, partial [Taenia solium]